MFVDPIYTHHHNYCQNKHSYSYDCVISETFLSNYVNTNVNKRKRSFEIQDNRIVSLLKLTVLKPQRPNLQLWKAVLICQLMKGSNGGHGLGKIAEKPPRDLRLSHGDKATKEALLKWPFFEIQSSTLHRKKAQTIGYQLRGFMRPYTTSKGPKMAAEF